VPESSKRGCFARPTAANADTEGVAAKLVSSEEILYMPTNQGQERLQSDARRLLNIFIAKRKEAVIEEEQQEEAHIDFAFKSSIQFLQTLPQWLSETGAPVKLEDGPQRYNRFMEALLRDKMTSATAMQTKPYTGDCFIYPFVVLMEATSIAEAIPSTFFESSTMSTMGALQNKRAYLKLARYRSKSRPWCVMTAGAGEGKSPGLKPFSGAADLAMADERLEMFCEGTKADSYHCMQSSTTAAAIHKLRQCNGYLWMRAADAGRCLSPNQAVGRPVDASKHTDLEYFLDAAHGDEFYHQTMKTRDAMEAAQRATRKGNPKKPIPDVPDTNFDHTNVTITFMQQDDYAIKFWACIAENHKVGLPQRCEFTFGGDCDPAAAEHCDFLRRITIPIVSNMIKMLLRTCGPKLPNHVNEELEFSCSQEQTRIFEKLELYMKKNKRNTDNESLKVSLPKSLYWLGTYIFFNHFVEQFWERALNNDVWSDITLRKDVSDAVFNASMNAVMRKYMAGQAALAVDVENRSWLPRQHISDHDEKIPERLLRVLRVCSGARITFEIMIGVIIEWRILQQETSPTSQLFSDMLLDMTELLMIAQKFGFGRMKKDHRGYPYLHKFLYESLPESVRNLMRKCRLPCYNWAAGSLVGVEVEVEASADSDGRMIWKLLEDCAQTSLGSDADDLKSEKKDGQPSKLQNSGNTSLIQTETQIGSAKSLNFQKRVPLLKANTPKVIFSEVKPNNEGLHMTSNERISFLRYKAKELNFHSTVKESKVAAASKGIYARTIAVCRGLPEKACPCFLEMFHYLQKSGHHECCATIIHECCSHNHGDEKQNVASSFTPRQIEALKAFLKTRVSATSKELRDHLLEQGLPYEGSMETLISWRKNFFTRAKMHHSAMPERFKTEGLEQCRSANLVDLVEYQKIDEWPKMHSTTKHAALCQLQIIPDPLPDAGEKLFVAFATEGMGRRFRHFSNDQVVLIVDVKQGVCKEDGFGIATLLGGTKDKLRNTTFGTNARGQRVQGRAFTTHGQLLLQGIVNVESVHNFILFFKAACWLWARNRPGQAKLEELYIFMCKDYAPGIERARIEVFGDGHSRPVNDVFHMQRAQGTLDKHLRKTTLKPVEDVVTTNKKPRTKAKTGVARLMKTHSSWIANSWITNRRLPSFDLFSVLHQGNLDRIEHDFGEKAAAEYLGNASTSVYTVRSPLWKLKQDYGLVCWNPDNDTVMTFALHWSGLSNMCHGYDCGSTPVEAANSVHNSFEKQVKNWTMKKLQGADVLKDIQKLYESSFAEAYDWNDLQKHYIHPPEEDPALLNSQTLANAGRTTALEFWELQKKGSIISHTVKITDSLEITAMPAHEGICLNVQTAERGMKLLRMYGQELVDCLLEGGLLFEHRGLDGSVHRLTRQRRVREHFVDVVYIVDCRDAAHMAGFRRSAQNPFCTCIWYARYGGCEHIKFMTWIATPLTPQPKPSPHNIPLKKRQGRTRGTEQVNKIAPKRIRMLANSLPDQALCDSESMLAEADPGL